MKKSTGILLIFLIQLFHTSCIYHERPQTDYGDLDILVDAGRKNIIHVIYKCEGTHFFNDLRNDGGMKDVKYTYYVVHHQLMNDGSVKTKNYRWFSENDKYIFYPQEDSLLRVLTKSGPVLKDFSPYDEVTQFKKYKDHSFERGHYQLDFPVHDSLYHWLADSLAQTGYNCLKEINRNSFFKKSDLKNDTLYSFKMDDMRDRPIKITTPFEQKFYRFLIDRDSSYIIFKNKMTDSLFLYSFDNLKLQVGQLKSRKDLSAVPKEILKLEGSVVLRNGAMEITWMKTKYNTHYESSVIEGIYTYGKQLKYYEIKEEPVFKSLAKAK